MNNRMAQTPQEMKEKIDSFRKTVLSDYSKKKNKSHSFNIIVTVLSDLLSGLFVGAGIGYLFYRLLDMHILVVGIFVLLGGMAGFLNLYKSLNRMQKGDKNENA